jgi:cysteine desulfurase family protein (TIGR01976 family)
MPNATAAALSPAQIRAQFPALARVHRGQPVAYFDGPGGTQVPSCVIAAMGDYLAHHNANTHWNYPSSAETDRLLAEAREAVADFLNATPSEVVFGNNMTTITYHVARGLGRGWSAGDRLVVTELDHHGNVGPWEAIAKDRGLLIDRIPFRLEDGTLDLDRVIAAIGPRTRLVAVGWASNALGTVTDVGAVCRAAAGRGVLSFVDAVHSAPHLLPDVAALGCDFLACSPYKFYGPHTGVLFGREGLLQAIDIPRLDPAPNEAPDRLETGTQNHEGIVGIAAAIEFLAGIAPRETRRASLVAGYAELHRRSRDLFERLWNGLGAIRSVRRFGPPADRPRTATAGFVLEGVPSSEVARRLADRALFLSHGDFYAATVVERLGLGPEGLVRAGCACYTVESEVTRLVEAVAEIAG